ncbi:SDR family NAD(P)-dependent oxidoreductase [Streptomyces sp. NPDC059943]|uniref:SDR family NAD(P)-dependent oxidoreductase n=1 Tax=Streptomyces sp. NPDC059943 TaxID=3347010 RepID=UPI0036552AA5
MNGTPAAGPLALVTGASAGIGYELALLFAINGFDLVATGRSEKAEGVAAELAHHGGEGPD